MLKKKARQKGKPNAIPLRIEHTTTTTPPASAQHQQRLSGVIQRLAAPARVHSSAACARGVSHGVHACCRAWAGRACSASTAVENWVMGCVPDGSALSTAGTCAGSSDRLRSSSDSASTCSLFGTCAVGSPTLELNNC